MNSFFRHNPDLLKACLAGCFSVGLVSAHAEEVTRAWHLAVPPVAAADALVIPEPPAASVFTARGDQLTDLSKALEAEETFGKGSWIVWNGTRHLLVIHGNRHTVGHADAAAFLREPHQVGIALAWYQGIGPGEAVPATAKATHRSEVIGRSTQHFETRWEQSGVGTLGAIEVQADPVCGSDSPLANVRLAVQWEETREGGPLMWSFGATFNTEAQGGQERVISQVVSPTGQRWTVTAKLRDLLLDGTPASERRSIEVDGKEKPVAYRAFDYQTGDYKAHRLGTVEIAGASLTIAEFDLQLQDVKGLLIASGKGEREETPPEDPFAVATNEEASSLQRPASCKDAIIPEELKSYAPVAMWDLKPVLAGLGLPLAEHDCAAYDPRLNRFLLAFRNAENLEGMEQLLMPMCQLGRGPNLAIQFRGTVEGATGDPVAAGGTLLTWHGEKTWLVCEDKPDHTLISINAQMVLSDSRTSADVGYDLEFGGFREFPDLKAKGSASAPLAVVGSPGTELEFAL